ncbi:MAG: serine/threonine-protein kinase [Polyangiaceae bacterium]
MKGEKSARDSGPTSGEVGSPSARELVGRTIGKYEIVRAIGGGGMGRVYEGINTTIGKRVALKFIEKEAVSGDSFARFQREAQAASAVESAHIVEIFDAGETDDGQPFIVMELLRGEDLGHRIRRLGKLELAEALQITAQILRGLHRAHEVGIIHRDLKPDNVFILDRDDDQIFAKIVDFGVSKMSRKGVARSTTITQEGTVLGTPLYMSPEQAQAQSDVDGRSDIYSVGAILYEMLAGKPPHGGATYEQVIVNICMKDAEDVRKFTPGVPEDVWRVMARALTRDRDARIPTASAFLDELIAGSDGILTGRSISTSDARDKREGQTVIRSDRGSSGSKTLGAVSTVAAVPPQIATTAKSERSSAIRNYLIGGGVGLAVGIGVLVYFLASAGATATRPRPAAEVIVLDGQKVVVSYTAAAPDSAPPPPATAPEVAASASASASASPSASASAKKPRVAPPPAPTPTGLHIMH